MINTFVHFCIPRFPAFPVLLEPDIRYETPPSLEDLWQKSWGFDEKLSSKLGILIIVYFIKASVIIVCLPFTLNISNNAYNWFIFAF